MDVYEDQTNMDDAVDLYLKNRKEEEDESPEEELEVPDDVESDDEPDEEGSDEGEESDEAEGEESEEEVASEADDEADVSVSVDGKDLKVKVKDLKRLYGQEASLTQKTQAVSAQVRAIEAQGMYLAKILDSRMTAATARVAKFADVDLFTANRELSPEDFDALRSAKTAAEAELAVVTEEANTFMVNAQNTRKEVLREQAKSALVTLKQAIPEWNDELYKSIRTYAVGQGLDRDSVNEIVDPGAIQMIHKAMLFDAAKAKTGTVTKKLIKSPKKALSKGDKSTDAVANKLRSAQKAASQSGDLDDVVSAYLASKK